MVHVYLLARTSYISASPILYRHGYVSKFKAMGKTKNFFLEQEENSKKSKFRLLRTELNLFITIYNGIDDNSQ